MAFNQKGISKTSPSESSLLYRNILQRFEAVCFGLGLGFVGLVYFFF